MATPLNLKELSKQELRFTSGHRYVLDVQHQPWLK